MRMNGVAEMVLWVDHPPDGVWRVIRFGALVAVAVVVAVVAAGRLLGRGAQGYGVGRQRGGRL
jgi:hypothetical protein